VTVVHFITSGSIISILSSKSFCFFYIYMFCSIFIVWGGLYFDISFGIIDNLNKYFL